MSTATSLPITFDDVLAARERLAPHLTTTALRNYPLLDDLVGHGVRVWVKHENHHPTQSFKIRNGLNAILGRDQATRARGVIGASTGNHGQGVAYAGRITGTPVTICVPVGNNPEKNAAIRALGAELVEVGATYEDTVAACGRLQYHLGPFAPHADESYSVAALIGIGEQSEHGALGGFDAVGSAHRTRGVNEDDQKVPGLRRTTGLAQVIGMKSLRAGLGSPGCYGDRGGGGGEIGEGSTDRFGACDATAQADHGGAPTRRRRRPMRVGEERRWRER